MADKKIDFNTSKVTFFDLLGLLFIAFKLAGIGVVASWSWWLVLLPIYGGLVLALIVFGIGVLYHAGRR